MEINADTLYENNTFDLGDVKHNTTPNFEFKSRGVEPIENVKAGCGSCTHPRLQPNGDILGYINISNAIGRNIGGDNSLRYGTFKKSIRVYINDGEVIFTKNKKGNNVANPNKKSCLLFITGNVIK